MSARFQAPRGTQDVLPARQPYWRLINTAVAELARLYGFRRIDTPVFETAALFEVGTGDTTDIVENEMYVFRDRGGDELALTPEATPAISRAYLEHGMASWPQPVRLFTTHPMFRYDRPQKGRYRQHTQLDCEVIGSADPTTDAEVIELLWRLYELLGITGLEVRLGSIDDPGARRAYIERLKDYYRPHFERLSEDSRRRFERNPLRLLDSKDERDQPFKTGAPKLVEQLSDDAARHLAAVQASLDVAKVPSVIDPLLVRGLDYYNRTVFEIAPVRDERAQATVGAGGRYDGLMEILGGPHTPAIGFGSGFERIILEMERCGVVLEEPPVAEVFVAHRAEGSHRPALSLAGELRRAGIAVVLGEAGRSLKAQLRSANNLGVRLTAIIADEEAADGTVTVKDMADQGEQATVPLALAVARIQAALRGP